jgi:hypothetical protein
MMDVIKGLFASDRPTGATVRRRTPAVRQSSPIGAISGMIEEARGDLSSSIRGLFGQQTPEEAQAQQLQEIKMAYTDAVLGVGDPNTPEGLREVAKKLGNNPDPSIQMVGVRLRQQADALQEKQIIAQRTARKEELNIDKLEKEIENLGFKLPTTKAGAISFIADLSARTDNLKNATEYEKNLVKKMERLLIETTEGNPNVVREKYNVKKAELIAKRESENIPKLKTIIQNIDKAIKLIDTKDGIVSGGLFPDVRFLGAEAISDFDILGVVDKDKIVRTAEYLSLVGEGVLDAMQSLGGSDSNEELRKMEKLRGAFLGYPKEALKRILLNIKEKELKVINDFEQEKRKLGLGEDDIDLNEKIKKPKNREDLINQELRKRGLIK